MAHILIRQPGDLYCVWSTVVDDIIAYDLTRDAVRVFFLEKVIENVLADLTSRFGVLDDYREGRLKPKKNVRMWDDVASKVVELRELTQG